MPTIFPNSRFLNISYNIDSWSDKIITDTSRKIDCPYFIGLNKNELGKSEPFIRLYDSKIAMLITLYGNIFEYMDSVKVKYDRRKEK